MERVEDKFLRYVRVDTPSDEGNFGETPSTACQRDLAEMLYSELRALNIQASITENAYVYAHIPANCEAKYSVGFIAHVDVVDEPKGYGVNPVVHADGRITSDGTTVLGADDKAGVAEIMALAEYLVSHPEIRHGKIGIAFTPDEEIGHGARLFDVKAFGCDFAYTVDGEELGEISYETFNGASFTAEFKGVNIHPGSAKGIMVNSALIANEFISALPQSERPETTEGRQGYYFVNEVTGSVESSVVRGIIRDHDRAKFEERKAFVAGVADGLKQKYGEDKVSLALRDQYYNCAEVILPHSHIIDVAERAMKKAGVEPLVFPIRGGTDGSSLSYMGLPCPNLCTGGHNAHGLNEYVTVHDLNKVVEILINIVTACAE